MALVGRAVGRAIGPIGPHRPALMHASHPHNGQGIFGVHALGYVHAKREPARAGRARLLIYAYPQVVVAADA